MRVDVRDGAVSGVPRLVLDDRSVVATTATVTAWTAHHELIIDGDRLLVTGLPHAEGANAVPTLTAGSGLVVHSAIDHDCCAAAAIGVEPSTGRQAAFPGEAWTAGEWVLWRDGADDLLARVWG